MDGQQLACGKAEHPAWVLVDKAAGHDLGREGLSDHRFARLLRKGPRNL